MIVAQDFGFTWLLMAALPQSSFTLCTLFEETQAIDPHYIPDTMILAQICVQKLPKSNTPKLVKEETFAVGHFHQLRKTEPIQLLPYVAYSISHGIQVMH